MRKTIVASVAGLMMVLATAVAHAAVGNIANTLHNLSALGTGGRPMHAVTETQICVFCHTPHNSSPAVPLWNRDQPTHTFNMYTSSKFLTNAAKGATTPGPESLMCLSCHDGVSAINVVHNLPNNTGTAANATYIDFVGFGPANARNMGISGAVTGRNLTNDHPISFSYVSASADDTDLRPIASAKANGVRFFGANNDRLECSSCHDPHVAYGTDRQGNVIGGDARLRPFLAVRNDGSFLCLSCHNK